MFGRAAIRLGIGPHSSCVLFVVNYAFSALTLLVGWQEGHPSVVRYWRGYLSGVRCK